MGNKGNAETTICSYTFNRETIESLKSNKYGLDWPVVYLLKNSKTMYIGETSSAYDRMIQHYNDERRRELNTAYIFYNDYFNKSAILDIENMLIEHVAADGLYVLQNRNDGQSKYHNYYERAFYQECFIKIWENLRQLKLAKSTLVEIENSDIFKFSPYKELTEEQYEDEKILMEKTANSIGKNEKNTYVVYGGAGTGKTVLAISLIKYITDLIGIEADTTKPDFLDDPNVLTSNFLYRKLFKKKGRDLRIAYVLPVPAFRKTIKNVFKKIESLKDVKVLSASELASGGNYDIVVVDEAHRLKRKRKLVNNGSYIKTCKSFGLDPKTTTELDWIEKKTNNVVILFYDVNQTVKMSDITKESILKYIKDEKSDILDITNQLRLEAGNNYIDIWRKIFNNEEISQPININRYDFRLYKNFKDMIDEVKNKDKEYGGLCRVVGGFAFPWHKKMRDKPTNGNDNKSDFKIQGYEYHWNEERDSAFSEDEIGCVYTCQGYDFNICGVLIGPDVSYDDKLKKVIYHTENFFDPNAKEKGNTKDTEQNILNAYMVLLTRGIKGTYFYIVDDKLREHIKDVFNKYLSEV